MSTFESGILRVLDDAASIVGGAFLVSDCLAVTCAHVVHSTGHKGGQTITLMFPDGSKMKALVQPEYWRDPGAEDIAVLRLDQPIAGIDPFHLGSSTNSKGHIFSTHGFPAPSQELAGRGEIVGNATINNIKVVQLASPQVTPGFSGAPIFDETTQRVVGMVVAITPPDRYQRQGTTAFAVPSETIGDVCPELKISDICPYRSLDFFTEKDSEFFFGRRRVIDKLLNSLKGQPRFLAVLGPSGSGKSSVVRAGLIPELKKGRLLDSKKWDMIIVRPHNQPFDQLAMVGLENPEAGLLESINKWLAVHPGSSRLVLVIDQFEELLVNVPGELRQKFIVQLSELLDAPIEVSVVIMMRDDFYSRFQQTASLLASWQEHGTVNIPATLTEDEVREIMLAPAKQVGLEFEPGLADAIIANTIQTTGNARSTILPLLEFTLTQLWEGRQDGYLLYATYHDLGGVSGGLAQWADRAYNALDKDDRPLARRILTDLVRLGDSVQDLPDSKQRRLITDLCRTLEEQERVVRVVDILADARLLATWREDKQEFVELIHDALIREWGQLRSWLEQDRSLLVLRVEIQRASAEWALYKPDESYLLHRGKRLHEVAVLLSHPRILLSDQEKMYLVACMESERERSSLPLGVHAQLIRSEEFNYEQPMLEIRLERPQDEGKIRQEGSEDSIQSIIKLDILALGQLQNDRQAYSTLLTDIFFADPVFRAGFSRLLAAGKVYGSFIVQLVFDASIPQVHSIAWELLLDPDELQPLSIHPRVLFLRQYTNSQLRLESHRKQLRLLVIQIPADIRSGQTLENKTVEPVDSFTAEFPNLEIKVLTAEKISPASFRAELAKGVDFLHLICPWNSDATEITLWSSATSGVAAFSLQNLKELLLVLDHPPRLLILESSVSSNQLETSVIYGENSFALLSAGLVDTGVVAALFYPPGVSSITSSQLLRIFLKKLIEGDISIGQALRGARAGIQEQSDWWRAVLYSFSAGANLWYLADFAEKEGRNTWGQLQNAIDRQECTPVLGAGLAEVVLGSADSFARKWALRHGLSSVATQSLTLPQIAQSIAQSQEHDVLIRSYKQGLQEEILQRYSEIIPGELHERKSWSDEELSDSLQRSVRLIWSQNPQNSYRLLATQPFSVYVTTAYDNLLTAALRAEQRDPQTQIFPWRDDLVQINRSYDESYDPSPQRPLVYHLLGSLDQPHSLVLTQDQYFDFLIGLTQNTRLIPPVVRYYLAGRGLLFLGFREGDLGFQLLLRYLDSLPAVELRKGNINVMQVEPSTDSHANSLLVQKMAHYHCSIFWGSTEDFARNLYERNLARE